MVSEDNPNILITYYKDPDWIDITDYAKSFRVRNSGVLKSKQAEITLDNKNGRFTSGSTEIPSFSHVRIWGDVRGVWDCIFQGNYWNYKMDFSRKSNTVDLVCRDYGQRLLMDTITWIYGTEDLEGKEGWTLKEVIENFLSIPDSGYPTEISLSTDNGIITTTHAREECNFDKTYLLDALKKIAERINYDGYVYLVDTTPTLVFKAVGTEYASPSVTLTHPFVFVNPKFELDDVYNYGLMWGGIEQGRPPYQDEWTEGAIAKYSPDIWIPDDLTVLSDDTNNPKVNNQSIKGFNQTETHVKYHLDIGLTEEGVIDATERFVHLFFYMKTTVGMGSTQLVLEDDQGHKIERLGGLPVSTLWTLQKIPIGSLIPIYGWGELRWEGTWKYIQPYNTFTWKIKKVYWNWSTQNPAQSLWVDGLYFMGGRQIHPLMFPDWNPPVKDNNSISLYDRRVFHYEDQNLVCKEAAQRIGQTILDIRKLPHRKIECKKGAKIWVQPSQVVTLNVPEGKINNEEWRILEIETDWKSPKLLRTSFDLVPKTFPVSTKAYLSDELAGLFKQ